MEKWTIQIKLYQCITACKFVGSGRPRMLEQEPAVPVLCLFDIGGLLADHFQTETPESLRDFRVRFTKPSAASVLRLQDAQNFSTSVFQRFRALGQIPGVDRDMLLVFGTCFGRRAEGNNPRDSSERGNCFEPTYLVLHTTLLR